MRFDDIETAGEAHDEGTWVPLPGGEVEVRVRPLRNPRFTAAVARLAGRGRKARRTLEDPNKLLGVTRRAVAEEVLLDWRGITRDDPGGATDEAGRPKQVPLPYTPELGLRLFKRNHQFFSEVEAAAQSLQFAGDEEDEEDAGNSETASAGNASGGDSEDSSRLEPTEESLPLP